LQLRSDEGVKDKEFKKDMDVENIRVSGRTTVANIGADAKKFGATEGAGADKLVAYLNGQTDRDVANIRGTVDRDVNTARMTSDEKIAFGRNKTDEFVAQEATKRAFGEIASSEKRLGMTIDDQKAGREDALLQSLAVLGKEYELKGDFEKLASVNRIAESVVTGQQDRLSIAATGEQDRLNIGATGEQQRLGIGATGEQDRLNIGATGQQERLNIGATGVEDRLTQGEGAVQEESRITLQETMRRVSELDKIAAQAMEDRDLATQSAAYAEKAEILKAQLDSVIMTQRDTSTDGTVGQALRSGERATDQIERVGSGGPVNVGDVDGDGIPNTKADENNFRLAQQVMKITNAQYPDKKPAELQLILSKADWEKYVKAQRILSLKR